MLFIRTIGHTSLGLGYSLVACDVVLASVIPGNSARIGGILMPIGQNAVGHLPVDSGTDSRIARDVPHAGPVSGRHARLCDVSHGPGQQSDRRRTRAQGLQRLDDVVAVAAGDDRAGAGVACGDSVVCLQTVSSRHPAHTGSRDHGARGAGGAWSANHRRDESHCRIRPRVRTLVDGVSPRHGDGDRRVTRCHAADAQRNALLDRHHSRTHGMGRVHLVRRRRSNGRGHQ